MTGTPDEAETAILSAVVAASPWMMAAAMVMTTSSMITAAAVMMPITPPVIPGRGKIEAQARPSIPVWV